MARTPFKTLEQDEQRTVVRGYTHAFRRWASRHTTPADPVQAVSYWWINAGPTCYSPEDGKLLREAIIALVREA